MRRELRRQRLWSFQNRISRSNYRVPPSFPGACEAIRRRNPKRNTQFGRRQSKIDRSRYLSRRLCENRDSVKNKETKEDRRSIVLVTGGTGFVASHCILRLLQHGYRARATVRSIDSAPKVFEMIIEGGFDATP